MILESVKKLADFFGEIQLTMGEQWEIQSLQKICH